MIRRSTASGPPPPPESPYHPALVSRAASASYQCNDFKERGGACKHIRALLLSLPVYACDWTLPLSEKDAILLSHHMIPMTHNDVSTEISAGVTSPSSTADFDELLELIDWGHEEEDEGTESTAMETEGESCFAGELEEDSGMCIVGAETTAGLDHLTISSASQTHSASSSVPVDEGLKLQAHARLRHKLDKVVDQLVSIIKDGRSLDLDYHDWANPTIAFPPFFR
ncbi:hypothetical protein CF319_g8250 [Tilletia indica]|nr:hypothetical protein CF319_g8250 [Tilletia indica]